MLALELARGKLNDVRNQKADWVQMGLRGLARALGRSMAEARKAFIKAAMASDDPEGCLAAAQASLEASSRAGDLLTEAYLSQILQNRMAATGKLTTHLGCMLTSEPDKVPGSAQWPSAFNACQVGRLVEADRAVGREVPLGAARFPACLVPHASGWRSRPAR